MKLQIINNLEITYFIEGFDNYAFCEDKNLYNLKRGRLVKKVYNNGSVGFNLNGKFFSIKKIKLLLYKKQYCPF